MYIQLDKLLIDGDNLVILMLSRNKVYWGNGGGHTTLYTHAARQVCGKASLIFRICLEGNDQLQMRKKAVFEQFLRSVHYMSVTATVYH